MQDLDRDTPGQGQGHSFPAHSPPLEPRYLPVDRASKKPLLAAWQEAGSQDTIDVSRWLAAGHRIGMTLPGLVALDLDPAQAAFGLQLEFGDLPSTWWQETPRGGRHYVFRSPLEGGLVGSEVMQEAQVLAWRSYPEGVVDVKAGPGSYIVLYPPARWAVPDLRSVAPLPPAIAGELVERWDKRLVSPTHSPPPSEAWEELVESTRHYRAKASQMYMLSADEDKLAATPPGRQERELNRHAYSWGRAVAKGFVGAATAEGVLVLGGMEMANEPGREPWTLEAVRRVVRKGILAGYRGDADDAGAADAGSHTSHTA